MGGGPPVLWVGFSNLEIADLSGVNSKLSGDDNGWSDHPLKWPQNLKQAGFLHEIQLLFSLGNLSVITDQSTVQMLLGPVKLSLASQAYRRALRFSTPPSLCLLQDLPIWYNSHILKCLGLCTDDGPIEVMCFASFS